MKLRFNRQEMADALALVCQVAAVRTPKEILKCVRLEAQADVLLLTATDLEVGLRYALTQVQVEKPGEVLVVADTLSKIVRECTDEVLDLELQDNALHLCGAGSHFQVVTQATTDFPPIAVMEGEPDWTMDLALLRRLIEWTLFAAARESTRYAMNGVLWEVTGEKLVLAATDGRRLSVGWGKITVANRKSIPQIIVPGKALSLVSRLPDAAEATVAVMVKANQLRLKIGGVTIGTSLVEGHFPKYQDVLPKDCNRKVELDTMEFQSALKRAALLTNEESKGVRLAFEEGKLTLSSRAPEQGEAQITLSVDYHDEPVEIGFNPVFLLDVLRVAHADKVCFAFSVPARPAVIRLGEEFTHVVMPVNLSSA